MKRVSITVRVHLAWWFKPYLHALAFFCWLTDRDPDWQKLERLVSKAVKTEVDL